MANSAFQSPIVNVDILQKISQSGAEVYAADGGASDTYVISLSPVPSAYTTGMVIHFKANTANTGAATLNVNSLGAKTIVKNHDTTLADNDIESGQIVTVVYDGTNFQMQSQLANASAGGGGDGAKMWGSVTYSAGTPTLDNSLNLDSITDNAVGDITFNITTDFANINYACGGMSRFNASGNNSVAVVGFTTNTASPRAVGSLRCDIRSEVGNEFDPPEVTVVAFGDQ